MSDRPTTLLGLPIIYSDEVPVLGNAGDITPADLEFLPVTDPATCRHPHDVVTPIPGGRECRVFPQCCRVDDRRPIELRPAGRD